MKFELEATVNETAQSSVEEQVESKALARTCVMIKNQSGSVDLKRGVRATFADGGSVTVDGSGGLNAIHCYKVDSASIMDVKDSIINFNKTQQIDQLEAKQCKIAVGDSQISSLKVEKSYCRFVKSQPQQAEIKGGITESFKGQWQQLEIDGGDFTFDGDEFQGEVKISGGARGRFNKAQFSGDVTVDDNCNVTFNECEFQNFEGNGGHIVLKGGKGQEGTFSDVGVVVLHDMEFQTLDCSKGNYTLNKVKAEEFTAKDCEINAKKLESQTIELENGRGIFVDGDLGEATFTKSQVTLKKCKSQKIDTTDGALKSSGADGQELTMQGGTLDSANDKYETVDVKELLGPNVIRNIESQELKASGDLASKLWLFNTRSQTMELENFGTLEMSACSPEELKIEACGISLLNDCDIQNLDVKDCSQILAGSCDIQIMMADGIDFMVTNGVSDMTAMNCGKIEDTESTIQATECTINIKDSTVIGMNCVVTGQGGEVNLTGDSVWMGTGANVTNEGLSLGMGFDPFQSFGSLSYDPIGLLLQSTVGNLDLTCVVGDINMTAMEGNINTLAMVGNIDTTATVGNVALTATAGQMALTAEAGDIVSTAGGANIINGGGAVDINTETLTVVATQVILP